MRKVLAAAAGVALMFSAGAAFAQSVPYGSEPAPIYGPYVINPGSSYGINSTAAGAAGADFPGWAGNASSQQYYGPIYRGRAATTAPPAYEEETVVPYGAAR